MSGILHEIFHVAIKTFLMAMFIYHAVIFESRNSAKAGIWAIIFAITLGW